MSDAHFFKGTSTDQDNRFADKKKKLMKTMKFPDNIDKKVDMTKVNLDTLKPWITKKITQMLTIEDDVVTEFVFNQLEATHPDGKEMQINLTGFLNAKNARLFMEELWELLLSAMENVGGIPAVFLEQKKEEIKKRQLEQEKLKELERSARERSRSKSNGRHKRSSSRDKRTSKQDKSTKDPVKQPEKRENSRFDQSKPKEVAEAILPTSLSDIKLPGERHFETNAVDGSNPGQSNKNETNVQSSSELTNMGKAASDKGEGNERPTKRDSSVESSSDKRSRSNSLRRKRRSTSRRRSVSRRKRSPSPRSRRRRRSPSYRPRSRSHRRSPRRRSRTPVRRRSPRRRSPIRRSRTPLRRSRSFRRSRSPMMRPRSGRKRSPSPRRRSRSPVQKARRSPIRRPRDISKSSSSSETSQPVVRRRGRSSSSDRGQSSTPIRKEVIQKEDMEPVEVTKRVYRKRSPSRSSASPSPQKVLIKRDVRKRRDSTSSAERVEMRRERSNEFRRQRVEDNLRRGRNVRPVRNSISPDRRRAPRMEERRNEVVRKRDPSPSSSSDAETLRKKLEEENRRRGKRRRSSSSDARSSRERQAKKMIHKETKPSKQQPLRSRRETSSGESHGRRVDAAKLKGEQPKGREVEEHRKPARESSESNDSRQPTPRKTVVEERRRVMSSKKEISKQRSVSSDEDAGLSPQRKHLPKDERKSLDDENFNRKHKSRHEGGECSNTKKVTRSSRSPVARKVAVVPPLKSKANDSDSDDQGPNHSRQSPYEDHKPKSDKVTCQRPIEKKFESDEEDLRSKQVRKRSSSAEASPEQKPKRRREDDNSDDSEEEMAQKKKKHAKKHKKHKKHKRKHHKNKSDEDAEEENEDSVEKKKSGSLDKLEQELREKALKSLKEAKSSHKR